MYFLWYKHTLDDASEIAVQFRKFWNKKLGHSKDLDTVNAFNSNRFKRDENQEHYAKDPINFGMKIRMLNTIKKSVAKCDFQ